VSDASAPALALHAIDKRFGAVTALTQASLTVAPGTVHAVLGENGAGKTTLLKIAFGLQAPDAGTIAVRGERVQLRDPHAAIALGIGMVHQHYSLVAAMTVAENVALGGTGLLRAGAMEHAVRTAATQLGFAVDPRATVASLSVSAQQRVEVIKAVARGARVLILDEPTAVLAPSEADALLERLRAFAANGGAVVLITHHLREALRYADDITVLRAGRTVLEAPAATLSEEHLVTAMVGTRLDVRAPNAPRSTHVGAPVLHAHAVSVVDERGVVRLRDATVRVQAGEIVGVAGVDGSGTHELLRVLAGRLQPTTGTVQLPDAVGFVPEDRHRDALLLDASLTENMALASVGAARGRLVWSSLTAATASVIDTYDVRGATPQSTAAALSGGNQQKFVLGRAVHTAPTALVVESPSRGLDVRATADIHAALRARRDAGAAIVVTSPDLDELLALADRVVVCYDGTVRAVPHDAATIGRAMVGALD
jgi:simple sugar transport system ATP-binding protein